MKKRMARIQRASKSWLAVAIVATAVWIPRIALACPVCTAGRDEENRIAFIVTTAFLTFFPLLMIGGIVWWLRNRVRRMERAEGSAPAAIEAQRMPAISKAL